MKGEKGLIAYMAQHPVAANLIMVAVLVFGLLTLGMMNVQYLPNFDIKLIRISAVWPGANPKDVEENLLQPMENQIKGLGGVDYFESTANYNAAEILVEVKTDANLIDVNTDISDRMDALTDLPADTEKIKVTRLVNYEPVARLVMSTEQDDVLNYYAQSVRDALYEKGIDQIYLVGNGAKKLQIEVPLKHLYEMNQGLPALARLVQSSIQSRPLGDLGSGVDATILTMGSKITSAEALKHVQIKVPGYGSVFELSDFAKIGMKVDGDEPKVISDGKPAVEMSLKRSQNTNTLTAAKGLYDWLNNGRLTLSDQLSFKVVEERWRMIEDRIILLIENAISGLVLIYALLFLVFNFRIAFWIAFGIPVSFCAAVVILYSQGGSINMISLFAMIMTLGIIVDDTIVVGEQAVTEFEEGKSPERAVINGAQKMLSPVLASSLTTVAAFLPLMMLSSLMGQILKDIPLVAITMILASLLECFFIMPNHLVSTFRSMQSRKVKHWRLTLLAKINHFQFQQFDQMVRYSVMHPARIIVLTAGLCFGAIGLIQSDAVGFDFFPQPPSPNLYLDVRYQAGTSAADRMAFLSSADVALQKTAEDLGIKDALQASIAYLNRASPYQSGGLVGAAVGEKYGSMVVEFLSPDQRSVTNSQIKETWARMLQIPSYVESVVIQEPKGGPPGQDLNIMFTGQTPEVLKKASVVFQEKLKQMEHVSNVVDNLPYGKRVVNMSLSPFALKLGLTMQEIVSHVRAALSGTVIDSYYQHGLEYPIELVLDQRDKTDIQRIEQLPLVLPNGERVLLGDCVVLKEEVGFEMLKRYNGQSVVSIVADVDKSKTTTSIVLEKVKQLLPAIESEFGVRAQFSKQDRYQKDTLPEMRMGSILGLMIIYLVIAWISRSLFWPLVIMVTIPLGVVGAVYGHFILGMNLTLLSLFGIFGLAGIVVNGSIILLLKYQELRRSGVETVEAAIMASCMRFRALMLTTLTTVGGLLPLIFEKSLQAQYLIPMATSLVFGLLVSTAIMLFLIPAIIPYVERFRPISA
jgi:multidrug efflux pump subunit AcrB